MEEDKLPKVVVHGFSTPTRHYLESLAGKNVVLEMMNGNETGDSISAWARGVLVDVHEDAVVLDQGNLGRKLVFARAIRAVYENPSSGEHLTAQSVPLAKMGAKLF